MQHRFVLDIHHSHCFITAQTNREPVFKSILAVAVCLEKAGFSPPPSAAELQEKRKALIEQTWKIFKAGLGVDLAKLFYVRIFEKYPEVRAIFRSTDMDAQAR